MRLTLLLPGLAALTSDVLVDARSTQISDTPSTYAAVTRHNDALSPLLSSLCSSTDFFKYYKLNLFTRECPYFSEDGAFCGNRACAVDTIEEDDVPEMWRASILGKLAGPSGTAASNLPLHTAAPSRGGGVDAGADHGQLDLAEILDSRGETCVQDPAVTEDRNFCVAEDEDSECVYVSLVDNEERYTGYHGSHAHAIWGSIYRENCFDTHGPEEFTVANGQSDLDSGMSGLDGGYGESGHRGAEFAQVLRDPLKSGHDLQDTCVEKRIFYRIISGMHASISTHICASYLNQLSGRWEPNATCFDERLRAYPERVSNIYFNYVLVSRAVAKLRDYLGRYTFCSGDPALDVYTSKQVKAITSLASEIEYDESPLFEDRLLKEDFRNRFRNISMLMDCVGCDKCRLWGKVQTAGYGAALKILFDDTVPTIDLRRGELVALFNTYGRLAHSLDALKLFNFTMPGSEVQGRGVLEEEKEEETGRPVAVSDDVLTREGVIPATSENPPATHANPRSPPLERLADKLMGSFESGVAGPVRESLLPRGDSLWRSFKYEWSEIVRGLKFVGQSYLDLPGNLWYRVFVAHKESSFWDFIFAARQTDGEL